MELVELLDKIDETAPKGCRTCRHMATHRCGTDCLYPAGTRHERGAEYDYANWEPGNWLRDLQAAQTAGARNIVIGGQGEADFSATTDPHDVARHLHSIACECGYIVGTLVHSATGCSLVVCANGVHRVEWDNAGRLIRIVEQETEAVTWPYFPEEVAA